MCDDVSLRTKSDYDRSLFYHREKYRYCAKEKKKRETVRIILFENCSNVQSGEKPTHFKSYAEGKFRTFLLNRQSVFREKKKLHLCKFDSFFVNLGDLTKKTIKCSMRLKIAMEYI